MATQKQEAQRKALEQLRDLFPAGSTVHTVVRHVTSSGMGRTIQVLALEDGGISDVSWLVGRAGLFGLDARRPGVKVNGCGMDMAFHLVHSLSLALHSDGYALTNRSL